jgi:alkyl hydroperoxide reductase subunit D
MGMNNVYYRFLRLSSNVKYQTIPARLHMNILRRTRGRNRFRTLVHGGVGDRWLRRLYGVAEKTLREKGVREESILAAVRIASVIHGLASVLETENALSPAVPAG